MAAGKSEIEEFAQQLRDLESDCASLSTELASVASALHDPGVLPSLDLPSRITAILQRAEALHTSLLTTARNSQMPLTSETPSLMSLSDLRQLYEALEQHQRNLARRASAIAEILPHFELAQQVRTHSGEPFAPLTGFHSEVARLREAVLHQAPPDEIDTLREGLAASTHPVAALVALLHEPALDDEQVAVLFERVMKAFGMPLALAAVRRKLKLTSPAQDEPLLPAMLPDTPLGEAPDQAELHEATPAEAGPKEAERTWTEPAAPGEPQVPAEPAAPVEPTAPGEPQAPAVPAALAEPVVPAEFQTSTEPAAPVVSVAPSEPQVPAEAAAMAEPMVPAEALASSVESAAVPVSTVPVPKAPIASPAQQTTPQRIAPPTGYTPPASATEGATAMPPPSHWLLEPCQDTVATTSTPPMPITATAQTVAKAYGPQAAGDAIPELLWALMVERQWGLAYWYARSIEAQSRCPVIPSWVIEANILGRIIQNEIGPAAQRLREIFVRFDHTALDAIDVDRRRGLELLLLASALRPSLLAPYVGMVGLLSLPNSLPSGLAAVRDAVLEFAACGRALFPEVMGGLKHQADWQQKLNSVRQKTQKWFDQARMATILYAPATAVWQKWLQPGGFIFELLQPVIEDDVTRLEYVRAKTHHWRNHAHIKREVTRTDNQLRGKTLNPITDRALTKLISNTDDALKYASEWIAKHDEAPRSDDEWLMTHVTELHHAITRYHEQASAELVALTAREDCPWPERAGYVACQEALAAIYAMIEGAGRGVEEPDRQFLFGSDLLRLPSLTLDSEGELETPPLAQIGQHILKLLQEPLSDWEAVFRMQVEHRNHESSGRVLDLLRRMDQTKLADRLAGERRRAIEDCRDALRRDIDQTRIAIENAVLADILAENERTHLIDQLEKIRVEDVLDFQPKHRSLEEIRIKVARQQTERIDLIRARVEAQPLSDSDRARVLEALERGQIAIAEEYLALLENGQPLHDRPESAPDAFASFFPEGMHAIEREFRSIDSIPALLLRVQQRTLSSVALAELSDPQIQAATEALRDWVSLQRQRTMSSDFLAAARRVLEWLGFAPGEPTRVSSPGKNNWFRFASALPPMLRVPPAFSSQHDGQYQVLCHWENADEDRLAEIIEHAPSGRASLVFYFGSMSEAVRRGLAQLTRQPDWTHPLLVIDDTLFMHLIGESGSRISALFQNTLPFMFLNPYTPSAAGNVPPEMFFGRGREARQLQDPYGPGFIFGGRQLGKSALLKHVQRQFHDPQEGRIAIYVDLKAEGIGEERSPDEVWPLLVQKFRAAGITPSGSQTHVGPEVILNHVVNWLSREPTRRILLLLDEADNFLDFDSRDNFARVSRLKGLMDRTDRRFKLVFAGLHNVQRFQKHINQPLAHLGGPISIGPLQPRDAEDLIITPMYALGYRFDDPSLVVRILSHTNYHASLIQLFCDELLRHLQKVPFDRKTTPPYRITEKHIEDAYRSQDLRDRIRERFEWTLNLDPRYRVIAYTIAYNTIASPETSHEGFTLDFVAKEVRTYWSAGFATSPSSDDMRALLDEMIGLGILVQTHEERYRLRSPNVLRLLGTLDQIERSLTEAGHLQPPPPFDAKSFRRALGIPGSYERSPLTASQEADLLSLSKPESGIRLVFGSPALGLHRLEDALKLALGETASERLEVLARALTGEAYESWLTRIMDDRARKHPVVLVEGGNGGNTTRLIERVGLTLSLLRKRRARERTIRVIFALAPELHMAWLQQDPAQRQMLEGHGQWVTELKRWDDACLHRWLDDIEIVPNNAEQRERILRVTGGWAPLLDRFAILALKDHQRWEQALDQVAEELQREPARRTKFLADIGLDRYEPLLVMQTFHEMGGPISPGDMPELVDPPLGEPRVEAALEYLQRLGLLIAEKEGRLAPEPVAARVACSTVDG